MIKRKNYHYLLLFFVVLLLFTFYFLLKFNIYIPCYFHKITNLYCPSCGGTRCVTSLLSFEFIKAFYYHPIFFISIVLGIIINIYYIYTVLANKKFKLLKWWYVIIWISVLLIFAILRNKY